ncbi:MAG: hypothetical protein ABEJ64_01905 [Candidatus Nanohaloarchaea archaeon]
MGFITSNLALILTGITTSIIGGLFYQAGNNAVRSGGSFRSKEEFIGILMVQVLVIGLITPPIYGFYQSFVSQLNWMIAAGAILILANLYINQSVTHWRSDKGKSAVFFVIGLILIYLGFNPI